eukprot:sb/3477770/
MNNSGALRHFSFSLFLSFALSLFLSLFLSFALSLFLSLSLSPSLSLSISLSQSSLDELTVHVFIGLIETRWIYLLTNQNFRCVTPSSVVAQINLFKVVLKSLLLA